MYTLLLVFQRKIVSCRCGWRVIIRPRGRKQSRGNQKRQPAPNTAMQFTKCYVLFLFLIFCQLTILKLMRHIRSSIYSLRIELFILSVSSCAICRNEVNAGLFSNITTCPFTINFKESFCLN